MTVVELFTSQAVRPVRRRKPIWANWRRDDVVALELHVDYWDYIGWKDRFAQSAFTDRQKAYSRNLGSRYVYTPQMVSAVPPMSSDPTGPVENALSHSGVRGPRRRNPRIDDPWPTASTS